MCVCVCVLRSCDIAGAIGGIGGTASEGTVLTAVQCVGNETGIVGCTAMASTECLSQELATVICQGKPHSWCDGAVTMCAQTLSWCPLTVGMEM